MQYVLIIHEVAAYPAWKAVFDQAANIRKSAGEISYQLLRYDNDANNIVHFSQWSSLDNARRFFYQILSRNLRPVVNVIYEREPFAGANFDPENDFRLTFDLHLRSVARRIDEITAAKIMEVAVFHSEAATMAPYQLSLIHISEPTRPY